MTAPDPVTATGEQGRPDTGPGLPVPPGEAPVLRVGLVGAGPWATMFHAPMLASCPETELAGVWSRRPEAAAEIAAAHGTRSFPRFDQLLDQVDALAFAVPPDVQAEMAVTGAVAGKALLLEKPLALDLARARELADVVRETGTPSQLVLTWRYADPVRAFLDDCRSIEPFGGSGRFITGGLLGGIFATPWRLDQGPLYDLGPHVLDLLDAALGPIVEISARGERHRWIGLQLVHDNGAVSQATLSAYCAIEPGRAGVEVYGASGARAVDTTGMAVLAFTRIPSEFAVTARSRTPHPLDVHRGLHLQELIANAARGLS